MTLRSAESSDGADRAGAEWEAGRAAAEPAEGERLDSAMRELRCAGKPSVGKGSVGVGTGG